MSKYIILYSNIRRAGVVVVESGIKKTMYDLQIAGNKIVYYGSAADPIQMFNLATLVNQYDNAGYLLSKIQKGLEL